MTQIGVIEFTIALQVLTPEQRQYVADLLSVISCEILKGEHFQTSKIELYIPQDITQTNDV